jgi:GntR family transcriptional regulator / MocR family aminotransferase
MELHIILDRSRRVPLSTQIAHAIRDAIFTQRLAPGTRLPPTRELAQRLQVARMGVVEAYEWLVADGYAETHPGRGTFIASHLVLPQQAARLLSEPARRTDLLLERSVAVDFRPGLPALDLFPRQAWKNALSRALQTAETSQLGYGPVEGLPRLRRVIAQYVSQARGLPVTPDRVIITVGTASSLLTR